MRAARRTSPTYDASCAADLFEILSAANARLDTAEVPRPAQRVAHEDWCARPGSGPIDDAVDVERMLARAHRVLDAKHIPRPTSRLPHHVWCTQGAS